MKKIPVDQSLSKQLSGLKGQAVLYDAEGRVLGYFSPSKEELKIEDMQLESPMPLAEIQKLIKSIEGKRPEEVGKPLKEILSRWGY